MPSMRVPGIWGEHNYVDSATGPTKALPLRGLVTYRLLLHLPATERLLVKIPRIVDSYRLYANNHLIAEVGSPSAPEKHPRFGLRIAGLPTNESGEVELILHAACALSRGRIASHSYLGRDDAIRQMRRSGLIADILVLGTLFVMGMYRLVLFAVRPRTVPHCTSLCSASA